jgi:phosphoribosylformylglycinamidine synthase II
MHRIEVCLKNHLPDAAGDGLVKDILDLGIGTVRKARVHDIYWLDAELPRETLERLCHTLLADPVTQEYQYDVSREKPPAGVHSIEVAYNAGVTDPVRDSLKKAIADLGISDVRAVRTSRRYLIEGQLAPAQLDTICFRLLVNPVIQHVVSKEGEAFPENPEYCFHLHAIDLINQDRSGVAKVARDFGYSDDEMAAILAYYKKQGRNPSDVELETIAQTWSEHCVHKTFRGKIRYDGVVIDSLLKSTIIKATREINQPWCLSVFEDNAGVIDFNGQYAVCFKVETHNHPSAVEPYGGAATGIGGVVRDPLGTGLGAKPILNTDVFCFGSPDFPYEKLPPGVLHPRRVFKGVRAGVADYGNRLGIPTLNGAVLFDDRYLGNPLVFCGTVGLLPVAVSQPGQQQTGDLVVVCGGRTGRDGIHGVTFASVELTDVSSSVSQSSVQIGNPIVEKKLIDILLQARERGLYRRITDCGGGGLSSAVGEMGQETGVRVDLDQVPLKYSGLSYSEIWISESQERMLLAVPPECAAELFQLFASENVEAAVIGEFTADKHLRLFYRGSPVGDLEMEFLHHGWPQVVREASWQKPDFPEPEFAMPFDLTINLKKMLGQWNICSKEWVIRQYDHEVQGGSVLKPLVGVANDGPGDAAIIRPLLDSDRGIIVSCGINPRYSDIDPYWMAASAIDEALRQVIAVGGSLREVALLDNFCWGSTRRPEMLGALVRAAQACHDMSIAFGTPFISGKDSLNNEFEFEGKIIAIPHTLLVSAIGVMEDTNRAVSMDFKQAGNWIYLLGSTYNELGGSAYFHLRGDTGNRVPRVDPKRSREVMERLSQATEKGLVAACHDLSEGGLGVTLAEMAFAGGLGAVVTLQAVPLGEPIEREDYILFSESNGRFLVEIPLENRDQFEKIMSGVDYAAIGEVVEGDCLEVFNHKDQRVILSKISELKEAWQKPLRW